MEVVHAGVARRSDIADRLSLADGAARALPSAQVGVEVLRPVVPGEPDRIAAEARRLEVARCPTTTATRGVPPAAIMSTPWWLRPPDRLPPTCRRTPSNRRRGTTCHRLWAPVEAVASGRVGRRIGGSRRLVTGRCGCRRAGARLEPTPLARRRRPRSSGPPRSAPGARPRLRRRSDARARAAARQARPARLRRADAASRSPGGCTISSSARRWSSSYSSLAAWASRCWSSSRPRVSSSWRPTSSYSSSVTADESVATANSTSAAAASFAPSTPVRSGFCPTPELTNLRTAISSRSDRNAATSASSAASSSLVDSISTAS